MSDPSSYDPFSRPPLAGSTSDEPWVKRNASLFHPREAWSIFKALGVVLLVVFFAVPLVFVFVGWWGTVVFVYLLATALAVRGWRRLRRRRARVPRW